MSDFCLSCGETLKECICAEMHKAIAVAEMRGNAKLQAERDQLQARVAELEEQVAGAYEKYRLIQIANPELSRNDHVEFGKLMERAEKAEKERDMHKDNREVLKESLHNAMIENGKHIIENAAMLASLKDAVKALKFYGDGENLHIKDRHKIVWAPPHLSGDAWRVGHPYLISAEMGQKARQALESIYEKWPELKELGG